MEFKIDTKETFCTIMPLADEISAKLTGALTLKCEELRQRGSKNFIIDFRNCENADKAALKELVTLHEECYGMGTSIVFTGMNRTIMTVLKDDETDLLINIAPKMDEAIDIISMEILERDLFNEE